MYLYSTELDEKRRTTLVCDKIMWFDSNRDLPCRSPKDIWRMCTDVLHLDRKANEYVWALFFDCRGALIGLSEISHGSVSQTFLTPREVYIKALLAGAVSVALVHNHPSGDISPSTEDCIATERIARAGNIVGVNLTDHLIIGKNGYYSFKEYEPERLEVQHECL